MAATVVVLAIAVVLLAIIVDPYRMYGTRPIQGLTALKPFAYRDSSFVKEYMLERVKPRTLLLGNSRVEVGLDPASPLWPEHDRPVFNAAEAGHDLRTALTRLRYASEVSPLNLVVVAADFADFLEPADLDRKMNLDTSRLPFDGNGRPNPQRQIQLWRDRLTTTLTISALSDSVVTLLDQGPTAGVTMTESGFNPLHQIAAAARDQGYYMLFAEKLRDYTAQYAAYAQPDFNEPMRHVNFRCLDDIVRLTTQRGIRLIVFINPYHYTLLELWHEDGLWPAFEAWKRALVSVVFRAAGPRQDLLTVLDFSGYSSFAMEAVPPDGDRETAMHWYWESGHYKSALGEHLIARMVGDNETFGQVLTPATVGEALREIADERQAAIAVASSVTR
jgi:hypothetical protein